MVRVLYKLIKSAPNPHPNSKEHHLQIKVADFIANTQ